MQDENINLIKLTAMLDKLSFLHKHEKKALNITGLLFKEIPWKREKERERESQLII